MHNAKARAKNRLENRQIGQLDKWQAEAIYRDHQLNDI